MGLLSRLRLFRTRDKSGAVFEEKSFQALVRKFQNIRYLVEQKATIDVIEKTPVAICITNEEHIYEYVNPAYCKLYGYDFDELIGKSFTIVVPEEFQVELTSLHDQFMNREYELEGNWEVVRKDGTRLKILASAAYVVDEKGRPKKVTFVLDMTEKLEALAKLERVKNGTEALRGKLLEIADGGSDGSGETISGQLRSLAEEMSALLD